MENVKINTLEFENVKRIRAVALEPTRSGLTVIGGNNNQGKTSILDTIAWALGATATSPATLSVMALLSLPGSKSHCPTV